MSEIINFKYGLTREIEPIAAKKQRKPPWKKLILCGALIGGILIAQNCTHKSKQREGRWLDTDMGDPW